ncbi:hypothetical protein, partial [Streptomyces scabiei]|uniref:hypothetical protein n=1 Tax=Streptomyces scabiei TaxID=1930 RepID=UPI001F479B5A
MSKVEVKAELLGRASRFAPLPGPHNSRARTTPGPAQLPDPHHSRTPQAVVLVGRLPRGGAAQGDRRGTGGPA